MIFAAKKSENWDISSMKYLRTCCPLMLLTSTLRLPTCGTPVNNIETDYACFPKSRELYDIIGVMS